MPLAGEYITCTRLENQIFISSLNFRCISYDIDNEAYSYVGKQKKYDSHSLIFSSKEKLYVLENAGTIFEMTKPYEVIDTKIDTNDFDIFLGRCNISFTDKEGKIFLLNDANKVFCFDPFGEKNLTQIIDLKA